MKFISVIGTAFLLLALTKISNGCHNSLHLRPNVQGRPGNRIRDLLSGHGFPSYVIDCVANDSVFFSRKRRSTLEQEISINTITDFVSFCESNMGICADVVTCSANLGFDLSEVIGPFEISEDESRSSKPQRNNLLNKMFQK